MDVPLSDEIDTKLCRRSRGPAAVGSACPMILTNVSDDVIVQLCADLGEERQVVPCYGPAALLRIRAWASLCDLSAVTASTGGVGYRWDLMVLSFRAVTDRPER